MQGYKKITIFSIDPGSPGKFLQNNKKTKSSMETVPQTPFLSNHALHFAIDYAIVQNLCVDLHYAAIIFTSCQEENLAFPLAFSSCLSQCCNVACGVLLNLRLRCSTSCESEQICWTLNSDIRRLCRPKYVHCCRSQYPGRR